MATQFTLQAGPRKAGHPNRDRAAGFVPGVVYGHGVEPVSIRVQAQELNLLLSRGGAHHLVQLSLEGQADPRTVVFKEIQHNPVTRDVVHIDFQAVSAKERIHADVPLRFSGEDAVTKAGGILQILLHSLRISCLPGDLPDHIDADVSGVRVGHTLTVGDIQVPAAITVLNDKDEVIVSVLAPRTAEPEAAPAPAEAKE